MFDITLGKVANEEGSPLFAKDTQVTAEKLTLCSWEEHCVECSPPYCYNNCKMYQKRVDGRCVRMLHGIQMVESIDGPLGYGIKCEFRKWAKLETIYSGHEISIEENKEIDRYNRCASKVAFGKYGYKLVDGIRRHLYAKAKATTGRAADTFYIDCYLSGKKMAGLLVQMDNADKIYYTHIHTLKKGQNIIRIPIGGLPIGARVFVTPLEETNTTIYFRWIDFIKEKKATASNSEGHAPKVKVVAWDLDNTLWKGTLVNDSNVKLNETAMVVIKELDRRGILNTICSKNDEAEALAKIEELGLRDYFLYPAINWGQKSENLKAIAEQLNLGINSFAFVDDNIREREEVSQALPMVRVFADAEIGDLLGKEEFDVPITETSKRRRLLYMEDAKRNTLKASFSDNYDEFLRSLEMVLTVEKINEENKDRCYELLSRSNQLNLSTNRYTAEEYDALLRDPKNVCLAFRVADKFGDYGIVSFMSLHLDGAKARIMDLVISCRIAKKKVENAIVRSLKPILLEKCVESIEAQLIVTKKNSPLVNVFRDLPFNIVSESPELIHYLLKDVKTIDEDNIIEIKNN